MKTGVLTATWSYISGRRYSSNGTDGFEYNKGLYSLILCSHTVSSAVNSPIFLCTSVVVVVVLLLLVWLIEKIIRGRKIQKIQREIEIQNQKNLDEAEKWIEELQNGRFVPPVTSILLQADEVALLHEHTSLMEAKTVRYYGGAGTRIKGIYIGGGASMPVNTFAKIDTGTLTLTTKRLVFVGELQSRIIDFKQILSVTQYADAIEVATSRKSKNQLYLVKNPVLWDKVIKLVISGEITTTQENVFSDCSGKT